MYYEAIVSFDEKKLFFSKRTTLRFATLLRKNVIDLFESHLDHKRAWNFFAKIPALRKKLNLL